jgi:hypothetical protein
MPTSLKDEMNEDYFIKTDRNVLIVFVYFFYVIVLLSKIDEFSKIYPLFLLINLILFILSYRGTSNRLNFSWDKLSSGSEVNLIIFSLLFLFVIGVNFAMPLIFLVNRIFSTHGHVSGAETNFIYLLSLSANSIYFFGLLWMNLIKFKKELDIQKYKAEINEIEEMLERNIISEEAFKKTIEEKNTLYCYGKMKLSKEYSLLLTNYKNGIISKDIFEESKISILDKFIKDLN